MANVGVVSLGCPKNLTDSEEMMGTMVKAGHRLVQDVETADVILVNTCAFVSAAEAETRSTMQEFILWKQATAGRTLVMTGCYTTKHRERIQTEFPQVDAFLGTADVPKIGEALTSILAQKPYFQISDPSSGEQKVYDRVLATAPQTAYIKIAEGCNKGCSFCIIPKLRGRFRSRPLDDIVSEARSLSEQGVQEIALISQESSYYGRDLGMKLGLETLLKSLVSIEGLKMIRFFYVYPENMSDELIELVRDYPQLCSYFDLPLQHVNSRVLKLMRRASTGESTRALIDRIRERVPQATIRANFIVGFPSETEEEFNELKDFLQYYQLDRVGIFPYSQEDGTVAATLPGQLPEAIKQARYQTLWTLQQQLSKKKLKQRVGTVLPVMVTHSSGYARSEFEAPEVDGVIQFKSTQKFNAGDWIKLKLTKASAHDMQGSLVS